jgi:hypothetical protein
MEEAPEKSKELSNCAPANGMNEYTKKSQCKYCGLTSPAKAKH